MKYTYLSIICILTLAACGSQPDLDTERQAIRNILQTEQNAHLSKNPQMLVDLFSDDFITVSQGMINEPTEEESLTQFARYFNTVEFEKWEDATPPVIHFSDDASMCWVTVDKEVVLTFPDGEGNTVRQSVRYAWVAVYEKRDAQWMLTANVSTNQQPVKELLPAN
ncbi:MAG TPA: hypothetical protein DCE41_14020 [Cytophagales bacterium]|nr:hypothetical protein [Cytophagales bacterium]HAA21608.1 hypothetical protein [Cytophagales bacterium]HAP62835.1 hypothetical protein [Cytophagales bacterium]